MSKQIEQVTMNWYSWLSKANLEPSLVHKYSVTFARNDLQEDDLAYFSNEFLQSIGIFIPEHRAEILKLSRKDVRRKLNGFSKLVLAMNMTKKLLTKNISKLSFHKNSSSIQVSDLTLHRNHRGDVPWELNGAKRNQQERAMITSRNVMRSGPIDRWAQQKLMLKSRSVSISGPLDGKVCARIGYQSWGPMTSRPAEGRKEESLGFLSRSPTVSGPVDRWALSPKVKDYSSMNMVEVEDCEPQSIWSMMFQDIKPT